MFIYDTRNDYELKMMSYGSRFDCLLCCNVLIILCLLLGMLLK